MSELLLKLAQISYHKHCVVVANSLDKNITKATDTHSERVTLLFFRSNNGYANAPQCYCIGTLLLLFIFEVHNFDSSRDVCF